MQILVVNTSLDWASRNPQFEDQRLTRVLIDEGHEAHDVPIPMVASAISSALALRLLPYAYYGDVLLGLGHRAAFTNHARKIVIIDEEIIDGFVGLTTADHHPLGDALGDCAVVVATSARAAAYLGEHTPLTADVVVDVRDLLQLFDGDT